MKKSLIALGLAVACVLTAAEKKDYSQYLKVASDLGTGKSGWTMTSSYANATVKKLNLEVEPSEVKAAAIEYEINCNPYDPRTKTYVTKEDYHWGDIIVKVNNTVVYKGHAGKYISRKGKGIQRMDIDPKVLKAGENTIKLVSVEGWTYFDYLRVTDDPSAVPETGLPGDVNCDGVVKIDDVVLLNRYVGEDTTITITSQGIVNGDCDLTGNLNAEDSTMILRYLARLDSL